MASRAPLATWMAFSGAPSAPTRAPPKPTEGHVHGCRNRGDRGTAPPGPINFICWEGPRDGTLGGTEGRVLPVGDQYIIQSYNHTIIRYF